VNLIAGFFIFMMPAVYCLHENHRLWRWVPEEGNFNTACFLLPPFQGEIKPPAMRVVVDLTFVTIPDCLGRGGRLFIQSSNKHKG
jgi:hypothetical protein